VEGDKTKELSVTLRGRLVSFFPFFYFALIVGLMMAWVQTHEWIFVVALPVATYILPVTLFRLFNALAPMREGFFDLSERKYNPWWTSHMLQFPFIALPWLESLLHFVPGLYTLWLRAWGSQIGKGVYWTPRTEIVDRSMMIVGDQCIIGHQSLFVAHLVEVKNGRPILFVKKIKIGNYCLVSADAQLGPGANIADGTKLKLKSRIYWRGEWK
jgi:hypothetical protein